MAEYTAVLLSAKDEAADIKSFLLTVKGQTVPYEAGQFLRLTLAQVHTDPRGPSRFFSLASSPTEPNMLIATTISDSPFKKALTNLAPGQEVQITAPFGKFTLGEPSKTHVFLSGGIGITPFRSMLKYAADQKLPHKIILLYSNKTPEDIVFKETLATLATNNSNLTIIHTLTGSTNNETMKQFNNVYWKTGRIDEAMIRKYISNIASAIFYVCGAPSMVLALAGIVRGIGVSEENLKTELFTGYE